MSNHAIYTIIGTKKYIGLSALLPLPNSHPTMSSHRSRNPFCSPHHPGVTPPRAAALWDRQRWEDLCQMWNQDGARSDSGGRNVFSWDISTPFTVANIRMALLSHRGNEKRCRAIWRKISEYLLPPPPNCFWLCTNVQFHQKYHHG